MRKIKMKKIILIAFILNATAELFAEKLILIHAVYDPKSIASEEQNFYESCLKSLEKENAFELSEHLNKIKLEAEQKYEPIIRNIFDATASEEILLVGCEKKDHLFSRCFLTLWDREKSSPVLMVEKTFSPAIAQISQWGEPMTKKLFQSLRDKKHEDEEKLLNKIMESGTEKEVENLLELHLGIENKLSFVGVVKKYENFNLGVQFFYEPQKYLGSNFQIYFPQKISDAWQFTFSLGPGWQWGVDKNKKQQGFHLMSSTFLTWKFNEQFKIGPLVSLKYNDEKKDGALMQTSFGLGVVFLE